MSEDQIRQFALELAEDKADEIYEQFSSLVSTPVMQEIEMAIYQAFMLGYKFNSDI